MILLCHVDMRFILTGEMSASIQTEQVQISPALIQPKQGKMPAGVTDTATVITETRGLAISK